MDMEETSREVLWMRQRYLEMFGRRRGTSGDIGERRRDVLDSGETTGGMGDMLPMPGGVCETSGDV